MIFDIFKGYCSEESKCLEDNIVVFDVYLNSVQNKLSKVKKLILKTLWEGGWVPSSVLLEITQQKNFDRRIRELRDQHGCHVETNYISGEFCYRLVSTNLKEANPRLYLTTQQKNNLFKKSKNTCQICTKQTLPGIRGLHADHKVPLSRKGTHNKDNWQALCSDCNNNKRRACLECKEDCCSCSWAFPGV